MLEAIYISKEHDIEYMYINLHRHNLSIIHWDAFQPCLLSRDGHLHLLMLKVRKHDYVR